MQSLVIMHDNQPATTSLVIANHCQYDHSSVIKLVRNHIEDLGEFGEVGFEIRLNPQGSPTEYAILNEQQATFLLTLMNNNPVVLQFKKALVKAFFQMRDALRLDQPEPDYCKRVDVTMNHTRGITNPNGLDIRYSLDLTKICMNPNARGVQLLERLTGIDLSDVDIIDTQTTASDSLQQFLAAWSRGKIAGIPFCPCLGTQLFSVYTDYCDQEGIVYPMTHRQFISGIRSLPGWSATGVCVINPVTGERGTSKMVLPPERLLADSLYAPRNWSGRGAWLFSCQEAFSASRSQQMQ